MKNNAWLRCEVRPGMFENEVAIGITTADGTVISFFIPADFVKSFSGEDTIRVEVVDRNADFGVVTLPGEHLRDPTLRQYLPARFGLHDSLE